MFLQDFILNEEIRVKIVVLLIFVIFQKLRGYKIIQDKNHISLRERKRKREKKKKIGPGPKSRKPSQCVK